MKNVGIRVGLNSDGIADGDVGQILLIDVDQDPDRPDVGDDEALRCARLQELADGDVLLDHQAADGRIDRRFKRRRRFEERAGVADAEDLQRRFGCDQVALRLHLGGLRLLQIGLRDGAVLVELLRTRRNLLRQLVRTLGLQVVGAELRIVGAGDVEHGLAALYGLARNNGDAADRPADLRDDRRGMEGVVSDRAGEAKGARQRRGLDGDNLDVRHLIRRDGEQLGGVGAIVIVAVAGSVAAASGEGESQ